MQNRIENASSGGDKILIEDDGKEEYTSSEMDKDKEKLKKLLQSTQSGEWDNVRSDENGNIILSYTSSGGGKNDFKEEYASSGGAKSDQK